MPGTIAAKDAAPLPGSDQRTILPPAIPAEALVRVTPDDADRTYQPGETAKFNVTVVAGPYPAEGFPIVYRLGQEMLEGEDGTAIVPAGGLELTGTLAVPGFLRCIVTAPLGGKEVRGLATVGFAPERLRPTQTEPADFDNFWEKQKAMLAKVPAEPVLTPLPERHTPAWKSYISESGMSATGKARAGSSGPFGPARAGAVSRAAGRARRGRAALRRQGRPRRKRDHHPRDRHPWHPGESRSRRP